MSQPFQGQRGFPHFIGHGLLVALATVIVACSWDWGRYEDHQVGDSTTCATGVSDERIERLSRGVDLYGWLEDPTSFAEFISDAELTELHDSGFRFVRASFYSPALFDPAQPDRLNADNLPHFGQAIERARSAGLGIVFVPYFTPEYKQQLADPATRPAALAALERMWATFGAYLRDRDPDWVFPELMGAPDFVDSEAWNPILTRLVQTVRSVAPAHTIIADANSGSFRVNWSSVTALGALQPAPVDRNVIYGFIFFDPVIFTHQGGDWRAEWPELASVRALPYPSSPSLVEPALASITDTGARADVETYGRESWGPSLLALGLGRVAAWSAEHCARVMCVEFGAYRQYAPQESALRWIGDVRTLLEQNRVSWSYWSYRERFGIAGPEGGPAVEPEILSALGLVARVR